MKLKLNIKRELRITAILIVVFALIAFTERMKGSIALRDIEIKIENIHENHYLDEADIMTMIREGNNLVIGTALETIDFRALETRIKKNPYIQDAELYSDLKGTLTVRAELRRPIARLVRNDGPDGYIAEDGTVMPVSEKFTSRVILISGGYVPSLLKMQNLNTTEEGKQILTVLEIIREDDFWKAQIAEIDINSKQKITIYSQVGDEKIEFGKPENLEVKFNKMRIFYKEILPRVGWNKYDRVNLEFEGQIVAE